MLVGRIIPNTKLVNCLRSQALKCCCIITCLWPIGYVAGQQMKQVHQHTIKGVYYTASENTMFEYIRDQIEAKRPDLKAKRLEKERAAAEKERRRAERAARRAAAVEKCGVM